MKFIPKIFIVLACLFLGGCWHDKTDRNKAEDLMSIETPFFIDISASEAKEIINYNDNVVIIDISQSFNERHLPGAINIPFPNFENEIEKLDKNKTYIIYGDIESYSQAIASRLAEKNFSDIYRLEGGIGSWVQAGYEIKD